MSWNRWLQSPSQFCYFSPLFYVCSHFLMNRFKALDIPCTWPLLKQVNMDCVLVQTQQMQWHIGRINLSNLSWSNVTLLPDLVNLFIKVWVRSSAYVPSCLSATCERAWRNVANHPLNATQSKTCMQRFPLNFDLCVCVRLCLRAHMCKLNIFWNASHFWKKIWNAPKKIHMGPVPLSF